jgi:hypothetical protein
MAWFAVCLLGVLKLLGIIDVPIQWVVVACGVALLFDMSQRSRMAPG